VKSFRRVALCALLVSSLPAFPQNATPPPGEPKVVRDGDLLRRPKEATNDEAREGTLLNALTPEETAAGWRLLFDGTKLTGFRGLQKPNALQAGWKIDRGALVLPKEIRQSGKMTGGDLVALAAFDDFEFSFEWKVQVSSNSGVLYFARGAAIGQKPSGFEFQIIDDMHHPDGLKGGPVRQTGALYGILPPSAEEKKLNEPGQWNEGRIVVQGQHVEHWINGAKVLEFELGPELLKAVSAAKVRVPPQFERKVKSPVMLLDQGEEIAFRNMKIRQLTATRTDSSPSVLPKVP